MVGVTIPHRRQRQSRQKRSRQNGVIKNGVVKKGVVKMELLETSRSFKVEKIFFILLKPWALRNAIRHKKVKLDMN